MKWRYVVADYGEVVAEELRFGHLISESKLPHSKEEIKRALIEGLKEAGPGNAPLKGHLELAFLGLQQFVAAEELPGEKQEALLSEMQSVHPGMNQFGEIYDRMAVLTGEYLQELRYKSK